VQAQRSRDSRGFPEFVYNSSLGEDGPACLNLKGNPLPNNDWAIKVNKQSGTKYCYTVAHWALTEARFRQHLRPKVPENYKETGIFLEDILFRVTQNDVVQRKVFDPDHYAYVPPFNVYAYFEAPDGTLKPFLMSRQMVLFCIERRKNWRLLQSRAGISNTDYEIQKKVLARFHKSEISKEDLCSKVSELIEAEKEVKQPA